MTELPSDKASTGDFPVTSDLRSAPGRRRRHQVLPPKPIANDKINFKGDRSAGLLGPVLDGSDAPAIASKRSFATRAQVIG
jgi:hypothetical protein